MYDLCEVKSSGEKVVLRGDDISVHSEMSVNGRLYIVPRTHSEKTLVSGWGEGGKGRGRGEEEGGGTRGLIGNTKCVSTTHIHTQYTCITITHDTPAQPSLPDQNQKPVVLFPERDGSREIAAHLTMYDWNLFSNIQQMEFIHQVFGRHKFGKITTNLDLLIRRFNEVGHMMWLKRSHDSGCATMEMIRLYKCDWIMCILPSLVMSCDL